VVSREPLFVLDLDAVNRRVLVGPEEALFDTDLVADEVNLVAVADLHEPVAVKARIRYRMTDADATIWQEVPGEIRLKFARPQRAITPGQSLVCYDGDAVVAGGTITRTIRPTTTNAAPAAISSAR
jgi:tRNA-specific 2-thiouridylase